MRITRGSFINVYESPNVDEVGEALISAAFGFIFKIQEDGRTKLAESSDFHLFGVVNVGSEPVYVRTHYTNIRNDNRIEDQVAKKEIVFSDGYEKSENYDSVEAYGRLLMSRQDANQPFVFKYKGDHGRVARYVNRDTWEFSELQLTKSNQNMRVIPVSSGFFGVLGGLQYIVIFYDCSFNEIWSFPEDKDPPLSLNYRPVLDYCSGQLKPDTFLKEFS